MSNTAIFATVLIVVIVIIVLIIAFFELRNQPNKDTIIQPLPAFIPIVEDFEDDIEDVIETILIDPTRDSTLYSGMLENFGLTLQPYGRFREGIIIDSMAVENTVNGDILYINVVQAEICGIYRLETFGSRIWVLYIATGNNVANNAVIDGRILFPISRETMITDIVFRQNSLYITSKNSISVVPNGTTTIQRIVVVEDLLGSDINIDGDIIYINCDQTVFLREQNETATLSGSRDKELVSSFVKFIDRSFFVYAKHNGGYVVKSVENHMSQTRGENRLICFNTRSNDLVYVDSSGEVFCFQDSMLTTTTDVTENQDDDMMKGTIDILNNDRQLNHVVNCVSRELFYITVTDSNGGPVGEQWYCD